MEAIHLDGKSRLKRGLQKRVFKPKTNIHTFVRFVNSEYSVRVISVSTVENMTHREYHLNTYQQFENTFYKEKLK